MVIFFAGKNPAVDCSTVEVRGVAASTVADSISVDRLRDGPRPPRNDLSQAAPTSAVFAGLPPAGGNCIARYF